MKNTDNSEKQFYDIIKINKLPEIIIIMLVRYVVFFLIADCTTYDMTYLYIIY